MKKSFIMGLVFSLNFASAFAQSTMDSEIIEPINLQAIQQTINFSEYIITNTRTTSDLIEYQRGNRYSRQSYNIVIEEVSDSLNNYASQDDLLVSADDIAILASAHYLSGEQFRSGEADEALRLCTDEAMLARSLSIRTILDDANANYEQTINFDIYKLTLDIVRENNKKMNIAERSIYALSNMNIACDYLLHHAHDSLSVNNSDLANDNNTALIYNVSTSHAGSR